MKNVPKNLPKMLLMIGSFSMLFSCGGGDGNTGGKWTQIDSVEDTAAVEQDFGISDDDTMDFNSNNSIKLDIDENLDFNWEEFKNELQARTEAIGEGFQIDDNEVTTAWENLNDDYSFQNVYRYRDNSLWVQTYYRKNNGLSAAEEVNTEDGKLLTKDSELKELWEKMEESVEHLKDSIF